MFLLSGHISLFNSMFDSIRGYIVDLSLRVHLRLMTWELADADVRISHYGAEVLKRFLERYPHHLIYFKENYPENIEGQSWDILSPEDEDQVLEDSRWAIEEIIWALEFGAEADYILSSEEDLERYKSGMKLMAHLLNRMWY